MDGPDRRHARNVLGRGALLLALFGCGSNAGAPPPESDIDASRGDTSKAGDEGANSNDHPDNGVGSDVVLHDAPDIGDDAPDRDADYDSGSAADEGGEVDTMIADAAVDVTVSADAPTGDSLGTDSAVSASDADGVVDVAPDTLDAFTDSTTPEVDPDTAPACGSAYCTSQGYTCGTVTTPCGESVSCGTCDGSKGLGCEGGGTHRCGGCVRQVSSGPVKCSGDRPLLYYCGPFSSLVPSACTSTSIGGDYWACCP